MNLEQYVITFLALEELKELGYKEVWVGCECPHWPGLHGSNHIIATPKNKIFGSPAMWRCSEKIFGKMSCGNGLREADQMQRSGTKIISGHYKLVDDKWESNIFKNE